LPADCSLPSRSPHHPDSNRPLSPSPTLPLGSTLVRSSLSVPIATSTVASLGDISNESPRGHYQRVTTGETVVPTCTRVDPPIPCATATFRRRNAAENQIAPPIPRANF